MRSKTREDQRDNRLAFGVALVRDARGRETACLREVIDRVHERSGAEVWLFVDPRVARPGVGYGHIILNT